MRVLTRLSGMQDVASEVFCHLKDKQHFLSYAVVQNESAVLDRSLEFMPPSQPQRF